MALKPTHPPPTKNEFINNVIADLSSQWGYLEKKLHGDMFFIFQTQKTVHDIISKCTPPQAYNGTKALSNLLDIIFLNLLY